MSTIAVTVDSVGWADLHNRRRWATAYGAVCMLAAVVALLAMHSAPGLRPFAVTVSVLAVAAALARPVLGVYLTVFLGLLGDAQTAWWYPFTKNLSSTESVLYVHDAVIISPLELMLGVTALAWWLHRVGGADLPLRRGRLSLPLAVFLGFILLAVVHGLATGGDAVVALWEVRPLVHLAATYLLVANLLTERAQYHRLVWTMVAALTLEAVHAAWLVYTTTGAAAEHAQLLGWLEHSASLHFNVVFALLFGALVYRGGSRCKRLVLPVAAAVVLAAYLPAERRSAMVALVAAALLLSAVLFRERRQVFWFVVPAVTVVGLVYVAAFWNGHGPLAFPAQAVKSVIAPGQLSEADLNSNLYRLIESYNVVATIRSSPLLGLGFGHPFNQVLPLPYLAFVWAEYLPHNSILWIWINTGIGGFVAMLYLMALSVQTGVRSAMRLRGDDAVLVTTAVLFVVMYVVYAYVDIAWDTQSMLVLGVALAVIDHVERLAARPGAEAAERITTPSAPVGPALDAAVTV